VDSPAFIQIAAFVIGLLFGSFLNVCISRLPKHESIMRPGSRCPECGTAIRWYDNIPLLSWILLRGRCRDCKQSIPWRYPLIELAVSLWFATVASPIQLYWDVTRPENAAALAAVGLHWVPFSAFSREIVLAIGLAILGFLLIGLMVMDWETMLLPNAFTVSGIAIGLFLVCIQAIFLGPVEDQVVLNTTHQLRLNSPGSFISRGNVFLTGPEALIFGRIVAVCGAAVLLLLVRWLYKAIRHREGMGLGDVKLIAMIAAFLGFGPAILSLFIGSLAASLYGMFLLVRGKAGATSKLPFGSFLCVGGLIAALYGNRLIDNYIALLR
jgi:leader peptidase (prepilin peptidase)/N-methyltransferase